MDVGNTLSAPVSGLDTAKVAGLIVIACIGALAVMRKSFSGVSVRLGD